MRRAVVSRIMRIQLYYHSEHGFRLIVSNIGARIFGKCDSSCFDGLSREATGTGLGIAWQLRNDVSSG